MMELEEDGEWDHGWISILRLFISVIILLKPVFQIRNIRLQFKHTHHNYLPAPYYHSKGVS